MSKADPQTTPEEKTWLWYYSEDEETYRGQCDTREAVIAEGRNCCDGDFYIMEAVKGEYDFRINEERYFEWLDSNNEEQLNPDGDGFADVLTKEQGDDLIKSINDAIDAWKVRTNANFEAWSFSGTRNAEKVENK